MHASIFKRYICAFFTDCQDTRQDCSNFANQCSDAAVSAACPQTCNLCPSGKDKLHNSHDCAFLFCCRIQMHCKLTACTAMLQRKITTSFFFSTLYCYIIRCIRNMSNPLKLNQLHAEVEKNNCHICIQLGIVLSQIFIFLIDLSI